MEDSSDDDLSLLQLAHWDVTAKVLDGPGVSLDELTAAIAPVVPADLVEFWAAARCLPGWRTITKEHFAGRESCVLAAPDPAEPGAWVVVSLTTRDGIWYCAATPDLSWRPRPGRATRRRHLRLGWSEPEFFVQQGHEPQLRGRLENTGDLAWHEEDDEIVHVIARIVDLTTGEPLPASDWVGSAPLQGRTDQALHLSPGATVDLPVTLATSNVGSIRAGQYGLAGWLTP